MLNSHTSVIRSRDISPEKKNFHKCCSQEVFCKSLQISYVFTRAVSHAQLQLFRQHYTGNSFLKLSIYSIILTMLTHAYTYHAYNGQAPQPIHLCLHVQYSPAASIVCPYTYVHVHGRMAKWLYVHIRTYKYSHTCNIMAKPRTIMYSIIRTYHSRDFLLHSLCVQYKMATLYRGVNMYGTRRCRLNK